MTTRLHAPKGAPCWTDLFTSDVDGSRRFYCDLFGWEAQEPSEEFGGYFMFTRDGSPIAGGMGPMPDTPATNTWSVYLATPDLAATVDHAQRSGAQLIVPAMPIADLGSQAVFIDPTGAPIGAWQAGTFPGFTTYGEAGSPSWFELHTRDHGKALEFYESVFDWKTEKVGETDEFRYTTMKDPEGDGELAGVMDARSFLPEGQGSHWSVYWHVDDAAAAVASVGKLGGSVVDDVADTPYGRLATAADPAGAMFKLRQAPS